MDEFAITGPLPAAQTTTLLEASAGTGKTWTIAALVARYVAEGVVRLDQMLVITFGRAASRELRERVRERLDEVESVLAEPTSYAGGDALLDLLVDVDDAERATRLSRVRGALTDFDAAAIVTTHQFCHLVLKSLGVAGDTDPGTQLVESLDDLMIEVVDDLFVRDAAFAPDGIGFTRRQALEVARKAVNDPRSRLEPSHVDGSSPAGRRLAFAREVRDEMDRRKRRLGVMGYDDLLGQLADALAPDDAPARQRMRQRWKVVLVDEFQDTDPTQWSVLDRAFTDHATMVLIGDPKQAIYAFRGGDVFTYLRAKRTATNHQTLGVNQRSDAALVAALQVFLRGAELGDQQIVVRPVEATHQQSRLVGAPANDPFRIRVLTRADAGVGPDKLISVGAVNDRVLADLAHDIKLLLTSGTTFGDAPLAAADVAVLTRSRAHRRQARDALAAVGVRAVIAGGDTIFSTPAAVEWLTLLEALEQPHRSDRVRAAGLTSFLGRTPADLVAGGDELTEELATTIRDWLEVCRERGLAAVFEIAVAQHGLVARLLSRVQGERELTDLRHLAESLHQHATAHRLGVVAVLAWLREQMSEEVVEVATERTRRLDSDENAVQILTVHGSKGLQFPVVYLPFAGNRWVSSPAEVLAVHDGEGDRILYVGGGGAARRQSEIAAAHEDAGESLRLLYVGMTRAQSQVVTWWSPNSNAAKSELHRMAFGRRPDEGPVPDAEKVPSDGEAIARLRAWAAHGGPVVERAAPAELTPGPSDPPDKALSARSFTRRIDRDWRRTSYSSLAAGARIPEPASYLSSEPEVLPRQDEPDPAPLDSPPLEPDPRIEPDPRVVEPGRDLVSPLAAMPVGATFGSLVHAVLETADPAAPEHAGDFTAELRARIDEQLMFWPVQLVADELAEALLLVCSTPLGPYTDNLTLTDIGVGDRLCELDFELPLAGGDTRDYAAAPAQLGDLAPLLREHLPDGDPLRAYADALEVPRLGGQRLHGYLSGSVDVVLRVGGRFVVVDYKTNWLGPVDAVLTSSAYTPERLGAAMEHSDYPLQALLYAVVLHRFLRWRLAGYDPGTHLGGVLYLYLRGMCGPRTPVVAGTPCGVFSWKPPVALVEAVSDLLDGRLTTTARS
ncbi:MAG: UvrD-helicase domain-containing protein [Actinomycetota bacterium]|nr:UvrD-helicase domain-containing protein [Actinomycetota bacterium]